MKIHNIETIPVRLPTRRVHQWANLKTPIGVYLVVKLVTDEGLTGLGEAPALKDWGGDHMRYYGETPTSVAAVIHDILAPALVGEDPRRIEWLHTLMDQAVKGYPYSKAAIDMALYDVVGKAAGVPAYQLLGGLYRESVPISHSIGLMDMDEAVAEVLRVQEEGIKTIKLKGGVEPKRDVELLRRVREALGADMNLTVDANNGYKSAKEAVRTTKAMEPYNILYMEQPVEGLDAMAEVTRRVDTPVMADESAWTTWDVLEIIEKKAADIISIYTTKPGGLLKAKKVAAIAEAAGFPCNVNGSVEMGVGNAANVHLAASTAAANLGCVIPVTTPDAEATGRVAGIYYKDDIVTEPFAFVDGAVKVPRGPGLGVELDEEKVERYRLDK
ncbi:MAG: mandelate racemase [Deltaproteobacteria bacterium]|nr:mandelate racemase [Deltaproteobacteria bacterium]